MRLHLTRDQAYALGLGHLWPEVPRPPSRVPGRMNKTEARFARILQYMKESGSIVGYTYEPPPFVLAHRTTYTVDFGIALPGGGEAFVEVKGGFVRDDAMVKLKVAADATPAPFFLARWKNGRWDIRRIPSRNYGSIACEVAWAT